MKRRSAAGRIAFEKAWDLAVNNKRAVLQSDIDHILQERFNGAPGWEEIVTDYTQEQINEHAFKIAYGYSLREELGKEDVHKIREIFYDDRTVFWYLISQDVDESFGPRGVEFDTVDEVVSVVYYKDKQSFVVNGFEWVSSMTEKHD